MDTNTNLRPVSLLICALGGEGGGVLSEWLVDIARHAGYAAQSTSIPGVAQRTGATTYYIEVFPVPLSQLGGKRPVFSLNPVPGALDAMVSSELLETARQIGNGMASPDRTLVITSSARTLTTQERMQLGDGRADSAELLNLVQSFSREHRVLDMAAVARECGTVVSAVMLGAIAGSGVFPFRRGDYEAVVNASGSSAAASLRGFARAFEVTATGNATCPSGESRNPASSDPTIKDTGCRIESGMTATASHSGESRNPASFAHTPKDAGCRIESGMTAPAGHPGESRDPASDWPTPVAEFASLGIQRLTEYQDARYAALYEQRLRSVLDAERAADPDALHDFALTRETARWLALWMAFDDIVRVADLKSRASRWSRVQREVKLADGDLLRVYDHFKPGVPEFAALLPSSWAERLLAWNRRRVARGQEPWALPLKVGTHSVGGIAALRTLASLKWLRPHGSRFAAEQAMIERWLAGIVQGARRDWRIGHEIALCGRLIKGYGTTNERGKENLLHVLDHLAQRPAAAEAIAAAREAALADDAGRALDAELVQRGAPARPVKEQPIRFVRRATRG